MASTRYGVLAPTQTGPSGPTPIDGSGLVPRDDANAVQFAEVSASEADQTAPNVMLDLSEYRGVNAPARCPERQISV